MKKYFFLFLLFIIVLVFIIFKTEKGDNYIIKSGGVIFEVEVQNVKDKTLFSIKNDNYEYSYLADGNKKIFIDNIIFDNNCIFLEFSDGTNSNDVICYQPDYNYLASLSDSKNELYNELLNDSKIEVIDNSIKDNIGVHQIYNFPFKYAFTTYKGLYIIDDEINDIKLFDNDVYDQAIKAFIDDKYIIANYNNDFSFNEFYIVDLLSKKVKTINIKHELSFDCEVTVEDDIMYIYDRYNKKHYKFQNFNLSVVENFETKINKFLNGYELLKETEYIYYLKKDNKIFKSNSKSLDDLVYLFDIDDKTDLKFYDSCICYRNGDDVYCAYNGYNRLLSSKEFRFNKTLDYLLMEGI